MNKVYVRDFETRCVIKEIDVSNIAGTSNYDRFERGLLRNMDLDKYYLDDDDYQREQAGAYCSILRGGGIIPSGGVLNDIS